MKYAKQAADEIYRVHGTVYTYGQGSSSLCECDICNNAKLKLNMVDWLFIRRIVGEISSLFLFALPPLNTHWQIDFVSGGSKDFAYDIGIPWTCTLELRDTGEYGFLLPEDQVLFGYQAVMKMVVHVEFLDRGSLCGDYSCTALTWWCCIGAMAKQKLNSSCYS